MPNPASNQNRTLSVAEMMQSFNTADRGAVQRIETALVTGSSLIDQLAAQPTDQFERELQELADKIDQEVAKDHLPSKLEAVDAKAINISQVKGIIKNTLKKTGVEIKHVSNPDLFTNPTSIAVVAADEHRGIGKKAKDPRSIRARLGLVQALVKLYKNKNLRLSSGLVEDITKIPKQKSQLSLRSLIDEPITTGTVVQAFLGSQNKEIDLYAGEKPSTSLETLLTLLAVEVCQGDSPQTQRSRECLDAITTRLQRCKNQTDVLKLLYMIALKLRKEFSTQLKIDRYSPRNYDGDIPVLGFRNHKDKLSPILDDFLIGHFLPQRSITKRDPVFVDRFTKLGPGVHPIIVGAAHVPNITNELEQRGIPCVVIAHREICELGQKFLALFDEECPLSETMNKKNQEINDAYELQITELKKLLSLNPYQQV